jgi:hypothetical protein
MELSGCTATVDVSANGNSSPLSITTTFANDFLFAATCNQNDGSFTWALPFTLDQNNNSYGDAFLAIGHDIVSTTGTYTLTVTGGGVSGAAIVAFETTAAPVVGSEGALYFDTTASPLTGYVYHSSAWSQFS